jgi:hypothetical protein
LRAKHRLRGNTLHILCESEPSPNRIATLSWLIPALQQTDLNTLIAASDPPIYQVRLYGCRPDQHYSNWTASIYLNQLDRHLEQLRKIGQVANQSASQPADTAARSAQALVQPPDKAGQKAARASSASSSSAPLSSDAASDGDTAVLALSNRSLAKRGQELAIASYLSETLSNLGVAVRVNVKTVPYTPPTTRTHTTIPVTLTTKRLWVSCEALYSPDPSLVAESIAQRLRDLAVEELRDAVILFQVVGEARPDWILRVDLTPPETMLREWARWGDVEALQRLLNQALTRVKLQISTASLRDETLHVFCAVPLPSSAPDLRLVPDQARVKTTIEPLLESLGPQGIHSAALYGQVAGEDAPVWVDWLRLPAAIHPALAEPSLTLAQQSDWDAIAFLLHRLLNPDLDKYLKTGGIHLQLLPKQDLLHIMSEAPACPDQQHVGPVIERFMRQLQLPGLAGIRVYGRRSGQKNPLWSYGADFVARQRLVPEVTPEFAVTDTYVDDLIPPSDESGIRPELTPADLKTAWDRWQQRQLRRLQQILVRSQLFIYSPDRPQQTGALPGQVSYQGAKVALVWGAVGVLLTLQTNWLMGRMLQAAPSNQPASSSAIANVAPAPAQPSPTPSASPAAPDTTSSPPAEAQTEATPNALPLPKVALKHSPNTDPNAFNTNGFTQAEPPEPSPPPSPSGSEASATQDVASPASAASLPFTPQNQTTTGANAAMLAAESSIPTFNNRQLDEKLKLYYDFLANYGPPDVVVVGSSRAMRGVDPVALQKALADLGYTNVKVFNFGVNGATAQLVQLILQRLLTPDQLPRLIVWADGARAFNSGAVDMTYNGIATSDAYQQLLAGTLPRPTIANSTTTDTNTAAAKASKPAGINTSLTASYESLDHWLSQQLATVSGIYQGRDRLKHLFQQQFAAWLPVQSADQSADQSASNANTANSASPGSANRPAKPLDEFSFDANGFLSLPIQFNPATYYQKYARVPGAYDSDYQDFKVSGKQEEALRSVLQLAQTRQIPIVFVNLPLTEDYLDPVRRQHEQEFRDFMVNLSMNQPGFLFRDLGELWTTQYDYFSDPSHLNRYGAYAISNHLAQDPLIPWSTAAHMASSGQDEGHLEAGLRKN